MDRLRITAFRCAVVLALAAVGVSAGPPETGSRNEKVHAEGDSMEQAALALTRAVIRDDAAALRKAVLRLEELCPRLMPEMSEVHGSEVVNADRVFHSALNRVRESAARSDLDGAFEGYIWVHRVCRACHAAARERDRPDSGQKP